MVPNSHHVVQWFRRNGHFDDMRLVKDIRYADYFYVLRSFIGVIDFVDKGVLLYEYGRTFLTLTNK